MAANRVPGEERRLALGLLAGGAVLSVLGYRAFVPGEGDARVRTARQAVRPDSRPRLPPGQQVIRALRPMGGHAGSPDPSAWTLRVSGAVRRPLTLSFRELLRLPQTEQVCDVHCVTRWSCLDTLWKGVRVSEIAEQAGVLSTARHLIFEAAGGYTANVPLAEATAGNVLVAYQLFGDPLAEAHGAPVRALVPDLYFWKSAKWLTGLRFAEEDEPGYWEARGYHNHGDPWREERFS